MRGDAALSISVQEGRFCRFFRTGQPPEGARCWRVGKTHARTRGSVEKVRGYRKVRGYSSLITASACSAALSLNRSGAALQVLWPSNQNTGRFGWTYTVLSEL